MPTNGKEKRRKYTKRSKKIPEDSISLLTNDDRTSSPAFTFYTTARTGWVWVD
jgi:hypothetical protein